MPFLPLKFPAAATLWLQTDSFADKAGNRVNPPCFSLTILTSSCQQDWKLVFVSQCKALSLSEYRYADQRDASMREEGQLYRISRIGVVWLCLNWHELLEARRG